MAEMFYDLKGNTITVSSRELFGDRPFHGEGHTSKAGNTVHLTVYGKGVKPRLLPDGEVAKLVKALMGKGSEPRGNGTMTYQGNWYTKPDAKAASDVFYGENPGEGGGY